MLEFTGIAWGKVTILGEIDAIYGDNAGHTTSTIFTKCGNQYKVQETPAQILEIMEKEEK